MTRFGKTLRMQFSPKIVFDVWLISSNSRSSFGPIALFAVELQSFVCDRATPPTIEKIRSKGIVMHAYGVSVYYAYTGSHLNGPGWKPTSEDRISTLITRAASIPKKLKRLVNVQ